MRVFWTLSCVPANRELLTEAGAPSLLLDAMRKCAGATRVHAGAGLANLVGRGCGDAEALVGAEVQTTTPA